MLIQSTVCTVAVRWEFASDRHCFSHEGIVLKKYSRRSLDYFDGPEVGLMQGTVVLDPLCMPYLPCLGQRTRGTGAT
jgi:hypothetical protein